jgi:hypothetical protein
MTPPGSLNLLCTSTASFLVESTLRGGHLVKVSSLLDGWRGLYRYEANLVLIARCCGEPPSELILSRSVRAGLLEIINAICGLSHDQSFSSPAHNLACTPRQESREMIAEHQSFGLPTAHLD